MIKKSIICATMLGVVVIALASSGGGRKKASAPQSAFSPIRTSTVFSLNSKPEYAGSHVFSTQNNRNYIVYKSIVTYQKGNTIYVIPSRYRINTASRLSFKNNLNMIDLKIRLCK